MFKRRILEFAVEFWKRAGRTESFPRSLEIAVAWALPLAVIRLPELHLAKINFWLSSRGILLDFCMPDRAVKACVIAKSGCGMVFLDGRDPVDEQRFSLAHEVSHFLMDYIEPRQKALSRLGPAIKDVVDGLRPATIEERLSGLLEGVNIGIFHDFLQRSSEGAIDSCTTLNSEDDADQLALELLAPCFSVLKRAEEHGINWRETNAVDFCAVMLAREFGLPYGIAMRYSNMLVSWRRHARSIREWLGIDRSVCRTSDIPSE